MTDDIDKDPLPNKFVSLETYQEQHPESLGHVFTISEAAEACGVSRDVIKRRNTSGAFPHAEQDSAGTWRIPLADLLAAGFTPNRPGRGQDEHQGDAHVSDRVAELEAEAAHLRALLAERDRVLVERDRALRIAEQALSALMPGPAPARSGAAPATAPPTAPTVPPEPPQAVAPLRRRWWQRSA